MWSRPLLPKLRISYQTGKNNFQILFAKRPLNNYYLAINQSRGHVGFSYVVVHAGSRFSGCRSGVGTVESRATRFHLFMAGRGLYAVRSLTPYICEWAAAVTVKTKGHSKSRVDVNSPESAWPVRAIVCRGHAQRRIAMIHDDRPRRVVSSRDADKPTQRGTTMQCYSHGRVVAKRSVHARTAASRNRFENKFEWSGLSREKKMTKRRRLRRSAAEMSAV